MRRFLSTVFSRASFVALPVLLVAGLLAPAAVSAEEHTFVLDPQHTKVGFDLGATGHDVHGLLHATKGEVRFDPEKGTASGELTLDARLAESGNTKRDKTMHKKVLESEAHPLIVFHAQRIEGDFATTGHSEFDLVGTVDLLDVPHELVLHTVADIESGEVTATVELEVPYVDWGLHNPSMLVLRVAKVVQVSIEAHGTLDSSPLQTSAN